MNQEQSTVSVRMDKKLKREAREVLDTYGLTTAYAVRTLFRRIVAEQAFPIDLKAPNAESLKAIAEGEEWFRRQRAWHADRELQHESAHEAGGQETHRAAATV